MSSDDAKRFRSIANSSGFPLQLRVAQVVNGSYNWRVILEEHLWRCDISGSEGFIDLAAINKNDNLQVMVFECKRVRETAWVFLRPKQPPFGSYDAKLFNLRRYPNGLNWQLFGWSNCKFKPSMHESNFCAIVGHEQGRRNLLERTAAELIDATEALAHEERRIIDFSSPKSVFDRIYIPIIVTTAELILAFFKTGDISLVDGSLPSDADFTKVPYIMFRKALKARTNLVMNSVTEIHTASERTVFIVNSEKLDEFLENWDII